MPARVGPFGELVRSKGLIFRLTHAQNVPFILRNGLPCSRLEVIEPNCVAIGIPELIDEMVRPGRRPHRTNLCTDAGTEVAGTPNPCVIR
jgi:hypothetical protein